MKLAIQTEVRGKPKGGMWQMGYGWENIEVDSWEEAFELFTVEGYSQTCELWNDNRKRENFLSRQIILIDADKEMFIKNSLLKNMGLMIVCLRDTGRYFLILRLKWGELSLRNISNQLQNL